MRRLVLLFAACTPALALGQVLTSTDFETNQGYPTGNLVGRGIPPWQDSSGIAAFTIQSTHASLGFQSVGVDTGPIGSSRAFQPISNGAIQSGNTILVATVMGYAAAGPDGFMSSYAGLDAYQNNPTMRLAAVRFRPGGGGSNGSVEIIANGQQYFASTPEPQADTWYRLVLMFDTTTGRVAGNWDGYDMFSQNGIWVGPQYVPPTSRVTDVGLYAGATGYNWLYYDDATVQAVQPGTVEGEVGLESWNKASTGVAVQIEIRDPNGNTLDSQSTTLDNRGRFKIVTAVRGTAYVVAKPSHWLGKMFEQPVTITSFGVHHVQVFCPNGDCSGDNGVEIGDYALISTSLFSTVGTPFWDARADLNGDDWVDIGDYAIMSSRYGWLGD